MAEEVSQFQWVSTRLAIDREFTTLQLISEFRIPAGKHLVIDGMFLSSSGSAEWRIKWDQPFFSRDEAIGAPVTFAKNVLRFGINAGPVNTMSQLLNMNIHIYDTFEWVVDGTPEIDINFCYHFAEGEMKIEDDIAEQVAEMRKVGQPQRSAGSEFFRAGDIRVIGIGENI